jgi:hypothetical protein
MHFVSFGEFGSFTGAKKNFWTLMGWVVIETNDGSISFLGHPADFEWVCLLWVDLSLLTKENLTHAVRSSLNFYT